MNEEMEWQPVRIAPEENICIPLQGEALKRYRSVIGVIVRVKPAGGEDFQCHGQSYLIHPDDRSKVCYYEDAPYLCEHQILAD